MARADRMDLVLGIVMIVLGVLVITGNLSLAPLLWIAGVALIVLGVLMLVNRMPGGPIIGVVCIVLGALLLVPTETGAFKDVGPVAHVIIGVLLLVFGIFKVMGK